MKLKVNEIRQYFIDNPADPFVLRFAKDVRLHGGTLRQNENERKLQWFTFSTNDFFPYDFCSIDDEGNFHFGHLSVGKQRKIRMVFITATEMEGLFSNFGGVHPQRGKFENVKMLAPLDQILKLSLLEPHDEGSKKKKPANRTTSERPK
jgi:hypothetical protein